MAVREGDPELITIEFTKKEDGSDYFYMNINRDKLRTTGFKSLSDFLAKLHIYKSMGDFDEAKKFFDHYSEVDEEMLRVREIVLANKLPRRIELQPNLFHKDDKVEYKGYDDTLNGVVQSFLDRWEGDFLQDVYEEWDKHAEKIRY